jgi:hypothetical protein
MVTDPENVPAAVGSKLTLMEQLAPAASVPVLLPLGVQSLLALKPAPVKAIDVMVMGTD